MADIKTASLTVLGGPLAGTQCELPESGTLTIGSSPGSSLYLDLPAVSPYHARVVVEAGLITVHDTGSSRTVHVNDNAIGAAGTELRNGDILWLGAPGDDDVVMIQCILPKRAAAAALLSPGIFASAATPTPEIETVALWATEAASQVVSETMADPAAVEDDTIVIDDVPTPEIGDEPELSSAAVLPEPASFPEGASFEVESEADAYVIEDAEALAEVSPTLLMSSMDEVAGAVEPSEYTPPMFAPPPAASVEDMAGEAPTFDEGPRVELPPLTGVAASPAPAPAAKPAEAPAQNEPGAAQPARSAEWQTSRPLPPSASQRLPPSASQRQRARPIPARAPEPEPAAETALEPAEETASSRRPMLLAVGGVVGVLALAGGGYLAWGTFGSRPSVPAATPAPVARVSEPAPPPIAATPEPEVTAPTPEPLQAATPVVTPATLPQPVATQPTQAPTPVPRPTPTPRATPTPAAAAPTLPSGPTGSSPEQQRAQQVAAQAQALVGQAEAALVARQYDAALSHVDGALRLEPGSPRATSLRQDVAERRDRARRRFVAGRTVVDSEKTRKEKASGGLVGFDTDEKAPDFSGRIEFEMTPASGIEANDAWTLRVFVMNQGRKPIKVQGLSLGTTANGAGSGGPVAPSAREIAPQQRALVAEATGAWREGTTSWVAEATLTAPKAETLRNTLTWK